MRFWPGILVLSCLVLVGALVNAQTPGKPDASPSEMSKFPPFPPKDVRLRSGTGHVEVLWKPSPLEGVVGYRVYRKSDSNYVSLGVVKRPPFVDQSPPSSGKATYTVTAIDEFDHESAYAKPVILEFSESPREKKPNK